MAYVQIPTRTTADPNASADINQLQDNFDALLDGSKAFDMITFDNTTGTAGLYASAGTLKYQGATIATGSGNGAAGRGWTLRGNLYTGTKVTTLPVIDNSYTIEKVLISSNDAPDQTISVDVNKNGVSIFNTVAQISPGNNTGSSTAFSTNTVTEFDVLTVDIDAHGSNTVGGNDFTGVVKFA